MSRKILIVAYGFPPSNQVAVHRILRLSKWLPKYGWRPMILTVRTKFAHPYFYGNEDGDLNNLISDDLIVHRASSFEYVNHPFWGKVQARVLQSIGLPDAYVTWVPGAVMTGRRLIKEHDIDVVLTTIGPNSTSLVGYFLKRLTSVKWVIDYRDPWGPNPFKERSKGRFYLEKRIEDLMLSHSDYNITTSHLITELYQSNYPSIANRFSTITNCFDHDLQFLSNRANAKPCVNRQFRIVHSGSFHPKRNPTSFLKSLLALANSHPEMGANIEVFFIGAIHENIRAEIDDIAQSTSVYFELTGPVSYKESMQYISSSDLLLAINGIEDRDNIFIPGKLFDYIAANKPILLIGHKGAASDIVEEGRLGTIRSHSDAKGIASDLVSAYQRWERSLPFEPDTRYVQKYHAKNTAKQLTDVLASIMAA